MAHSKYSYSFNLSQIEFSPAVRVHIWQYTTVTGGKPINDSSLVALLDTMGLIGRSLAMPPDTPPAIVAIFRSAFLRMVADEAYRNEAEKMKLRSIPKSAERLGDGVRKALAGTDSSVVARARALVK